jgi:hypothetical protein
MQDISPAPCFGPTTSLVEAFLHQLRQVAEQPPGVTLPAGGTARVRRAVLQALAEPPHRQAATRAVQQAVAEELEDLS